VKQLLELNKVYCGDCLEVMNGIDDKNIDMILCDLPYGMTQCKWDSQINLSELWKQYNRIMSDNCTVALFGSNPFASMLIISNIKLFKYEWIWQKNRATGHLNAHRMPMKEHENIIIFYNTTCYNPQGLLPYNKIVKRGHNGDNYGISGTENLQKFTNYPRSILKFSSDFPKMHPTQKPVELCEYLIKTYTNEGETVLDNCCGSGTTGVAAKNLHRNYILIEKEEKYCQIAEERLQNYRKV